MRIVRILVAFPPWFASSYTSKSTARGGKILNLFEMPLAVLAACLPLGLLVAYAMFETFRAIVHRISQVEFIHSGQYELPKSVQEPAIRK